MRHIIPISGKDSLCTALVQTARFPDRNYEYLFTDTGCELPETYQWLNEVESKTGFKINRVGASLEEIINKAGVLPSVKMRFCTDKAKIKPMEKAIGTKDFTIYIGLRSDEPQRDPNVLSVFPLREAGITLPMVFTILEAKGLLPPDFFWQTIYDATDRELKARLPLFLATGFHEWQSFISKYEFRQLFAGRTRGNCYFCFYQKLCEWVWLHETHPELFEKALEMEANLGTEGYTWRSDYSLKEVIEQRDRIIEKRAKQIANYIEARINGAFSGIELDSEIVNTSCGLLCGK